MIAVLMGVSGVGKTTLGLRLAAELGWPFLDADDFHPAANVAKMSRGLPLTDADRAPWLDALAAGIRERLARGESAVLACSALKHGYRERLRVDPSVRFVYLHADPALIRRRLQERRGHFFAPELLESQLAALEEPREALRVDAADAPDVVVRRIVAGLGLRGPAR